MFLDLRLPDSAPTIRFACGPTVWTAVPEVVGDLFDAQGLKLVEWQRSGQAEAVKSGRHRTVYRIRLGSAEYYVKHYRVPDWQAVAQNLVRPCRARLEWEAVHRVAHAGIDTFAAVAVGWRKAGPVALDSFLITRAIDGVETVRDFVQRELHRNPEDRDPRLRQELARQLGRLAARLHHHGLYHRDFHAGNILLRIDAGGSLRLWLIDLHGLRRRPRLIRERRERNLAVLSHFFFQYATAADRLRFFRAYRTGLAELRARDRERGPGRQPGGFSRPAGRSRDEFARAVDHVESYCRATLLHELRRGDRKWSRGNRQLIVADVPGRSCRGLARLGRPLLETVRDDPSLLFAPENVRSWHIRGPDRKHAAVRLDVDGGELRCFALQLPLATGFLRWGRTSTVRHIWNVGHALLRRGIGTTVPLLFVEDREGSGGRQSLVFEDDEDDVPIDEVLRKLLQEPGRLRRRSRLNATIRRLGEEVRKFHDYGFRHGALSLNSIHMSRNAGRARIRFQGLEHVRLHRMRTHSGEIAGLARLEASARSVDGLRLTHRLRFLKAYLGRKRFPEWKSYWRRIARLRAADDDALPASPRAAA